MNNFIIVYMESFSAYDPTTKTGELHAFLTIDISLRSFPFHSAWRTMTHDKSLWSMMRSCSIMMNYETKMKTMTHDKSLWSMKRSCSFMMNYEPKMKTENKKQKTAKRKMKTSTPSSSLRMPGKHENENRSEHRRESQKDRDERRRLSSSSPEPAKRSRKRSRSKSPEKKSRAHQRAASPSASPSPKREKYYENKADKSNSRQRSSSRSRYNGRQGQHRPAYSAPTPFKAGKPILEPAHQNIGSRGTFGPVWYRGWYNSPPDKPASYTITFAFGAEYEHVITHLAENFVHYATKTINDDGPICRRPYITMPQLTESEARNSEQTKINKAVADEHLKLFSGSPAKAVKTAPAPPTRPLPSPAKDLGKALIATSEDMARNTAEQCLHMTFALDSFETHHSVFAALGEFMDVDVGQNTSTVQSRTAATDKLVTAMMKLIKDKKPRPSYPEIQARANTIKFDHLKTCGATAVTQANTPLVKIEPTDDGGTPKQETSNEQKKRRKSTKQ